MKTQPLYFGIDVSKRRLHLATPDAFLGEFDNSPQGHRKLLRKLLSTRPDGIVLEASGGYERALCDALHDANIPVTRAQPGCIRHFAKSLNVLAKTDEIDTRVIARFGLATKPPITPKTPENQRRFRALLDRRDQIVADRVREANRLEACADTHVAQHIRDQIDHLQDLQNQLDRQIKTLLEADDELRQKKTVMTQLKGVGEQTAAVLLAHFAELGSLDRQQVAALAGLAPHPNESGRGKGKRRIYGGRAAVRKALYMAAKSAARFCPVISEVYTRLRNNGKSYNQALIACARKMLVRLNTLLKELQTKTNAPNEAQST